MTYSVSYTPHLPGFRSPAHIHTLSAIPADGTPYFSMRSCSFCLCDVYISSVLGCSDRAAQTRPFGLGRHTKGWTDSRKSWQSWSLTQCRWGRIQIKWLQKAKVVRYVQSRNSYCISRHVQPSAFSWPATKLPRCFSINGRPFFLSTPLSVSSRYKTTVFILNNLCKQSAFTKAYLRFHKMASK